MFVIMGIAFYTTRIVLSRLGVNDYGIYNVIGGVVGLFALFSSAITSSISRYLTYEIGRANKMELNKTFASSMCILLILSGIFIIITEPIGIWFINEIMQISPERLYAAHWVFQCSVLTFGINLISIPYNALIIAYEKMSAFAIISMVDALLKLVIALLLYIVPFDKLIFYAAMLAVESLMIRIIYRVYAGHYFSETKAKLKIYNDKFKAILSFTGWSCIGGSAGILNSQGINVLLNLFFGTIVNAARGVTQQVTNAITSFASNFILAVQPQIIKNYAAGNYSRCLQLVYHSARLSFYLLLILSVPILIETEFLLKLWLANIPTWTVPFVQLALIQAIFGSIATPLLYLNQATGDVKFYQISAGGIILLNFPICWLLLKLGYNPVSVYYCEIILTILGIIARLLVINFQMKINIWEFVCGVILKGSFVLIISILGASLYPYFVKGGFGNALISMSIAVLWTCLVVFSFGLNRRERHFVYDKAKKKFMEDLDYEN